MNYIRARARVREGTLCARRIRCLINCRRKGERERKEFLPGLREVGEGLMTMVCARASESAGFFIGMGADDAAG